MLLAGLQGVGSVRADAANGPNAWQPVGLSGGGGMFSPAISPADPDLMLLNCDMSAAYLSEDGGHNWRMIHHAQLRSDTRCRPGFHPTDPAVIYASSGGRLRISRDRGRTFMPLGDLRDSLYGEIAINPCAPEFLLVGVRRGGCWRSHDAGATWTPCAGPEGLLCGVHFDRLSGGRIVLVGTDRGIWRSDDQGRTWTEKTAGLPWTEVQAFSGGSDADQELTMLYCSVVSRTVDGRFAGGVFCSRDCGETWHSAMGRGINTDTERVGQWAHGEISQYEHVFTTDTRPMTVYAMNTSTGFHPPHHETVYRSDDGGQTWRDVYFVDPRFERYNVAPNYVTASTGQSYKGGDAPFGAAICNRDPERLLLVRSECHVTHDGGRTWFNGHTYPAAGQETGPGMAWVCNGLVVTTTWHYYIDPFESNRHYIAYTDIGLARSLDSGRTWIWWDKRSWAPWRNTCYELAFDPEIPGKVWGAFSNVHDIPNDNIISERHGHQGPGGVCVSQDFAASWQAIAEGIPPRPVTSLVLDPSSARGKRTLYAGVFMEGVYKSIDDGATWTRKSRGLGHAKNLRVSRVVLHADGTLFAMVCGKRPAAGKPLMSEGVGLYRSRDAAETWVKVNDTQGWLYPKDFSVHPADSQRILVGVCDAGGDDRSGGLYLTEDGGRNWNRIGREGRQTFGGYFHPTRKGWIYMTLTEGAPGSGLWLTKDGGRSWQAFDQLPFSNIQRVAWDPSNEDLLRVTTFGGSVWRGPSEPGDRAAAEPCSKGYGLLAADAPPSPVIAGIDWAPLDTIVRRAKGSDNFPLTWSDDDALYTTFGDGWGFRPFVPEKLSLGLARITGMPGDFQGQNIRSESIEQRGSGRKGRKGWGILSVDGVLYLWLGHADREGGQAQLAWSNDHGQTWTYADWRFTEFGLMGFVNFGKDYAGARDEFVYAYSHDGSQADTPADRFVLMRAPRERITERDAWQFFVRQDAEGLPVWSDNVQDRGAVFERRDACLRSAMTYHAGIQRYLWWQATPQPPGHVDRGDTRFEGGFGVYDAPEPWGPWTTAFHTDRWDTGPGEHGDFPAKWINEDGRELYLVFTGDDQFSVRKATLRLRPSGPASAEQEGCE